MVLAGLALVALAFLFPQREGDPNIGLGVAGLVGFVLLFVGARKMYSGKRSSKGESG